MQKKISFHGKTHVFFKHVIYFWRVSFRSCIWNKQIEKIFTRSKDMVKNQPKTPKLYLLNKMPACILWEFAPPNTITTILKKVSKLCASLKWKDPTYIEIWSIKERQGRAGPGLANTLKKKNFVICKNSERINIK